MFAQRTANLGQMGVPCAILPRVRRLLFAISVLVCITAVLLHGPVRAANDDAPRGSLNVLLVGNSYTRFNLLPTLLQRVADSSQGLQMQVSALARGGYTLRRHLRLSGVQGVIAHGHFSHVVLQGHSLRPIDRAQEMEEAVTELYGLIEAAGAKTVLYETWARRQGALFYRQRPEWRTPDQMQARIGSTYRGLARRLGIAMAPVGSAFMLAGARRDALSLYRPDGAHPGIGGSYLAACVLFGAISGRDPRATSYRPAALSEAEAQQLRNLAALALQAERHPIQPAPQRPVTALDVARVVTGLTTGAPLPPVVSEKSPVAPQVVAR